MRLPFRVGGAFKVGRLVALEVGEVREEVLDVEEEEEEEVEV
jgi:hypothetical protein